MAEQNLLEELRSKVRLLKEEQDFLANLREELVGKVQAMLENDEFVADANPPRLTATLPVAHTGGGDSLLELGEQVLSQYSKTPISAGDLTVQILQRGYAAKTDNVANLIQEVTDKVINPFLKNGRIEQVGQKPHTKYRWNKS